MAYDEGLTERIREILGDGDDIAEKRMFGGICFLSQGRMIAGIIDDRLMARVGPQAYEEALKRPHAHEMDFTHRPMRGFVTVEPEAIAEDDDLRVWLDLCLEFVDTLPPK
jgi:TfoX/Sxy family transcriptional regulator of competence genes